MDFLATSLNIQAGSNNDQYIWRYSFLRKILNDLRKRKEVTEVKGHYYVIGINEKAY